jgi:UDP-N-acetyl-D-mannosaminuronic acid dehydrogenase
MAAFDNDVLIVGGCGRVGLPLGLALADRGQRVVLYDRNQHAVDLVMADQMPFLEAHGDEMLSRVLGRTLSATTDAAAVTTAEHIILAVGTPVDEHLNPDLTAVSKTVFDLGEHLRDGQLVILRSTLYPGTTRLVEGDLARTGKDIEVVFCPERIAEGRALTELYELPQIVSGRSTGAIDRAEKLFRALTSQIVRLSPEEAELAKLFTNTWRYIKFAAANQMFVMSDNFGLDYENIRRAIALDYPRAADLPRAGLTAGPCLLKDTMQLAAFSNNNFVLGHAAMLVNEGLPFHVVTRMERAYDLGSMTVGILGMAFKPESDDIRSSLSYKLKRILRFKAKAVLCHDPYVTEDPDLSGLEEVLAQADLLVLAVPHDIYRDLPTSLPIIRFWGENGSDEWR